MKKIIFITLLISISTVLGLAQEVTKANKEEVKAISEVAVVLLTPTGEKVQSVTTNNQGAFNFTNVAAGKYIVAIGKYDVKAAKGLTEYRVMTAREAGSGMATGRRMHKPFVITKELDKTSATPGATAVAIPTGKSALKKEDVCDDDCDRFVEVSLEFGEKVNAGLHQAGSALANGASLLGGSIPGGAILSSALTIQQGIEIKETGSIDGNIMMRQQINKSKSNVKNNKQTQGATFGEKVKHDTVKNSVGNIR